MLHVFIRSTRTSRKLPSIARAFSNKYNLLQKAIPVAASFVKLNSKISSPELVDRGSKKREADQEISCPDPKHKRVGSLVPDSKMVKITEFSSTIDLSEKEKKICDLLRRVSDHLKFTQPDKEPPVLRVAGGWVRDKLLKRECHDLDIAVNSMTGYELATHVNDFLKSEGINTKHIAKIQLNPERSKHLETATTIIFGLSIDFANLRSEKYNTDSRIPTIEFGTPYEDACRRDTTMNALFYNIHTEKVEDFTEKGLDDLRDGIIRTPLAPFETFRDDPLRVLRVIRFASRFNFKIVEEAIEAMKRPEIKSDLAIKVSRERVGVELDKMLSGANPSLSIEMIQSYGLFHDVFTVDSAASPSGTPLDSAITPRLAKIADHVYKNNILYRDDSKLFTGKEDIRGVYLAICLYPFKNMTAKQGKKPITAAQAIIRDGVKLSNADMDTVTVLHHSMAGIRDAIQKMEDDTLTRVDLGLMLRTIGSKWPSAIFFSCIVDMPENEGSWSSTTEKYIKLLDRIETWNLCQVHKEKPIIDGKAAVKLLGVKPGPAIRGILDSVMLWQLEHPEGSVDQCKEYLKELYEQSSQYLHWRFSKSELAAIREGNNRLSISRVKENLKKENELRQKSNEIDAAKKAEDVVALAEGKYLSVKDELDLIDFYKQSIAKYAKLCRLPSQVMATAMTFFKRFYIHNTVMDYNPKNIMATCVYLATKTENSFVQINDFIKPLAKSKITSEDVLKYEFVISQSLQFEFSVYHPYKSSYGLYLDIQSSTQDFDLLTQTYEKAESYIYKSLYTDACFHYMPPQIALAAWRLASTDTQYEIDRYKYLDEKEEGERELRDTVKESNMDSDDVFS
ncbi:CCA tRNA nucleotidyltransferase, mitochondrial [Mycoemilia scoparia]|uniref:CCA tRNA nucleotidyltransferase, mitochondrial n=1 Tax=Mycoemilia scoparia TaxID=417184 RepID=A0A9W8DR09_9FUNG|nr:CCA tRNA nucleotidyltransferase, mitochondrial [Mycoemilia scoparia]